MGSEQNVNPHEWTDRLKDLRLVRKDLDSLPDHERVGLLLVLWPELDSFVDAIGELAPDHKEWWLRVHAKARHQFTEGLTHGFEERNRERDSEGVCDGE